MKKNLIKLVFVLALSSIFLTCDREEMPQSKGDLSGFTQNGEQFMKQLKANPRWEFMWEKINENGSPLINNALLNSDPNYNLHYLVPILNSDKIVDRFALFPLDITPDNVKGTIPLNSPVIIDKTLYENSSILKTSFGAYVPGVLQKAEIEIDQVFIPGQERLLSRYGSTKTIIYHVYFLSNGHTIENTWKEDVGYLISLLESYEQSMQNCPYSHRIIIHDDYLEIIFCDIPNYMAEGNLYEYVCSFTSVMLFRIPEVVVAPSQSWGCYESYMPTTYNVPDGIYMLNPLQSLLQKIHSLLPPPPPVTGTPGRVYISRTGQKLYKEGPLPQGGRKDRSNYKCVPHSIEYGLKLLGINDEITARQIYREYQSQWNWYDKGIPIDKSYVTILTRFFTLSPVFDNNYQALINEGKPVIGFLPSNMRQPDNTELHCVMIVGYNTLDGWFIYYNPTTGSLHEAPGSFFTRPDVSYGLKKIN